jgi:hypothetical protein
MGYGELLADWPFVSINDCLEKYEKKPDTQMKLKTVGNLILFTQIDKPVVAII